MNSSRKPSALGTDPSDYLLGAHELRHTVGPGRKRLVLYLTSLRSPHHRLKELSSQIPGVVPASQNKDFGLAINCV